MANEIEAKIKIRTFEPVLSALREAGAEFIGEHEEIDQYYDARGGKLRRRDCGLRVRTIRTPKRPTAVRWSEARDVDTSQAMLPLLTYKGPRKAGGRLKVRLEVQTRLADAPAMGRILEELGYSPTLIVRKKRCRYRLMGCNVELDELRGIGRFVEIEGPSERAVNKAVRALHVAGEPTVESYISMVANWRKRQQRNR